MKRIVAAIALALSASAGADTLVNGYVRSDGTYVAPHYQTPPDSTRSNNYSTQGNYNPYTGQTGTKSPYDTPSQPSYNPQPYGTNSGHTRSKSHW